MKKIYFVFFVLMITPLLAGCSSSSNNSTATAVAETTKITVDSSDSTQATERINITDPALASYLSDKGISSSGSDLPTLTNEERAKIGLTAQIKNSEKYGISGTAQIVSQSVISLKNFSFNGACLPLLVYLIRTNSPEAPLTKIKEISAPVSGTDISLSIPSNIALTNFDAVGFYCSDNTTKAVSSAAF